MWFAEVAAVVLLAVLLTVAVRGHRVAEGLTAVGAAGIALVTGLVGLSEAGRRLAELAPTVGFLAAILVLAHLADTEGVFAWLGDRLATAGRGDGRRLLGLTFAAAAATTVVLSLDATVVLLTPVVLATATRSRLAARPHLYACAHLSNSASLLLPVSNLTNLLAFGATGLSFLAFTGLMTLPWLVVLVVEFLALTWYFRADLRGGDTAQTTLSPLSAGQQDVPRFALGVLAAVLVGFAVGSAVGVDPWVVALAGVVVLGTRGLVRRTVTVADVVRQASPGFLAFVLGLAVVVQAVAGHGLAGALARVLPCGADDLAGLLAIAGIAALLANLVNNLPATLVLLSALGAHPGAAPVLAMLLGVNIGPNATYLGSLATVLWRRVLAARDIRVRLGEFTVVGLLTVPAALALTVTALWLVTRIVPVSAGAMCR